MSDEALQSGKGVTFDMRELARALAATSEMFDVEWQLSPE